jgi:hypothetical protein
VGVGVGVDVDAHVIVVGDVDGDGDGDVNVNYDTTKEQIKTSLTLCGTNRADSVSDLTTKKWGYLARCVLPF